MKQMTTLNELTQDQVVLKREMCKKSLYYFFQEFWGEISGSDLLLNWHIQYICEELEIIARRVFKYKDGNFNQRKKQEDKLYDLIINIPPRTSKSSIVSNAFVAWCWINDPTTRFITGSYSVQLSLEQADKTRQIIRSNKFKTLFPEIRLRADASCNTNYKLEWDYTDENGNKILMTGGNRLSCSPTGTSMGYHADMIIVDDPLNPTDAGSTTGASLSTVNHWINSTLSGRKTNRNSTVTIIIMQRLCETDPCGVWIEDAKRGDRIIKHICLPAEISNNVSPPGLKKFYVDGLLDPISLNRKVLKEAEASLGPYGYAGQMMQTPAPIGEGMFKTEKFNIIKSYDEKDIIERVRYWDKAGTAGGGKYTAGVLIARTKKNQFIVIDIVRGQWDALKREEMIKQTAYMDGLHTPVWIEQEGGSGGKESAEATIRNLSGFIIYVDIPKGDKALRAVPYSVQVNAGNVSLLEGEWNRAYINECRFFPVGKYKDQIDASSAGFNVLFKGNRVGIWGHNLPRTRR